MHVQKQVTIARFAQFHADFHSLQESATKQYINKYENNICLGILRRLRGLPCGGEKTESVHRTADSGGDGRLPCPHSFQEEAVDGDSGAGRTEPKIAKLIKTGVCQKPAPLSPDITMRYRRNRRGMGKRCVRNLFLDMYLQALT